MRMTFRLWLVVFILIASVIAINPTGYFKEGVQIKTIAPNSQASLEGIERGEIISSVNGQKITSLIEFSEVTNEIFKEIEPIGWTIETENETFEYESFKVGFEIDENLTITSVLKEASAEGLAKGIVVLEVNGEEIEDQTGFYSLKNKLEPKVKLDLQTNKGKYVFFTTSLDMTAGPIPKSNIKAGLDLSGGSKALVKPVGNFSTGDMDDLITITKERLNVFGLSDVIVRSATDLSGNTFMLIEVAGTTPAELEELIGQQGKFEAKIGNDTVFIGGKEDITSVCRNDAKCAGIRECQPSGQGQVCTFEFVIYLSQKAAKKQAELTGELSENITASGSRILSEPLDLYLDDSLVDTLQISANLKGKATTNIAITGPGSGATQQEAFDDAMANMIHLQTVLVTGSLPVKLSIEKLDSISSLLGKEFIKNVILAGLAAIVAVAIIIFVRYRDIKLVLPVILTLLSEVVIILGAAALIRWNLDLASIAGIIAAIGTGVDDQVIIIDEARKQAVRFSLKERIKRAFFIIMGAFATTFVAMIPLWWAGAGIIRGFALTTLIGISIGVLITRPAFANIIQQITKE
ncbi:hypothetical protein ACFLZZ_01585 [Nanoarchaeota archaeon]